MSWSYRAFAQPTVAAQRARAERAHKRLRASGEKLDPVARIAGAIARTFWGKSWCTNLESYSDFSNRLRRGRTYVRSGAVLHLSISEGCVVAKVQGSSLYDVAIAIKPLTATRWNALVEASRGDIASLDALLSGDLAPSVLRVVTDRAEGMFPAPREISFECSCPDYASMCKHVAAALYGVGARIDTRPELLFVLRGRDHRALVAQAAAATVTDATAAPASAKLLDNDSLEGIFGIAIDAEPTPLPQSTVRATTAKSATKQPTRAKPQPKTRKAAAPKANKSTRTSSSPKSRIANDPFAALTAAVHAGLRRAFERDRG
jgi:uncharacterized Zn finger protein